MGPAASIPRDNICSFFFTDQLEFLIGQLIIICSNPTESKLRKINKQSFNFHLRIYFSFLHTFETKVEKGIFFLSSYGAETNMRAAQQEELKADNIQHNVPVEQFQPFFSFLGDFE